MNTLDIWDGFRFGIGFTGALVLGALAFYIGWLLG